MQLLNAWKNSSYFSRIISLFLFFCLLYLALAFIVLPPVAGYLGETQLRQITKREARIGHVFFNPFTWQLVVDDFEIKDRESNAIFMSFKKLHVDLETDGFLKKCLKFKQARLEQPFVSITLIKPHKYNFSDLVQNFNNDSQNTSNTNNNIFNFSILDVSIINGSGQFRDKIKNKVHFLQNFKFNIPLVSNIDEQGYIHPEISFMLDKSLFNIKGHTQVFSPSLNSDFDLKINKVNINKYWDYIPISTKFNLINAILNSNIKFHFEKQNNNNVLNIDSKISILNVDLQDNSGQNFKIGKSLFKIKGGQIDEGIFNIYGNIEIDDINFVDQYKQSLDIKNSVADIDIKQNKDFIQVENSKVNVQDLRFNAKQKEIVHLNTINVNIPQINIGKQQIKVQSVELQDGILNLVRGQDGNLELPLLPDNQQSQTVSKNATKEQTAWQFKLDKFITKNIKINLRDKALSSPQEQGIDLHLAAVYNLGSDLGNLADFEIQTSLLTGGEISSKGKAAMKPLSLLGDVNLKGIKLSAFNPYLPPNIKLNLNSGQLDLQGKYQVEQDILKSAFSGQLDLHDIQVASKDNNDQKYLILPEFKASQINWQYPDLSIASLNMTEPQANIKILSNGKLELVQALAGTDSTNEVSQQGNDQTEQKLNLEIASLGLQNGILLFEDAGMVPPFSAKVSDINLDMQQIAVHKRASLDLSAILNQHAPLKVTGSLSPLTMPFDADLQFKINNMDMIPLTPYTVKFLGYPIDKGKMNWDMNLNTQADNLQGGNQFMFERLELGKKLNKDAPNVPIKFGLALLQNSAGGMSLDVPMQGAMSDPKFSVGGVIMQAILGIFGKIATAPFSLISGIFGGGQDLNEIIFSPGQSELGANNVTKLSSIGKALSERPRLHLEVTGQTNLEDETALQKLKLESAIQAAKSSQADGQQDPLVKIWQEFVPNKPFPVTTKQARIELERKMPISSQELQNLARVRAENVRNYLQQKKNIAPKRIFLQVKHGQKHDKSEVSLKLKP